MSIEPRFLTAEDVLALHAIAIEDQGGDRGLRDRGLLESAVAMPRQQFSEQFLHTGIGAMAAAYAFHIARNHAFVDGNKRAATAAMIAFLSDNGWSFDAPPDNAEPVICSMAAGDMPKGEFTDWLTACSHAKPRMELREFFARITGQQFISAFAGMLPAHAGPQESGLDITAAEAAVAMPALRQLAQEQLAAAEAQDHDGWTKVTAVGASLCTLYRIAEDMGYEW